MSNSIRNPYRKTSSIRDQFLKDLAQMYHLALEAKNFAVALRALELRGKELGLFKDQQKEISLPSLSEMTQEELEYLLGQEKKNKN